MQGIGIHTAGQHLAGAWHDRIIGTAETRDRVEKNDNIMFVLDQAFGFFNNHFSNLHVACRGFIKGRTNHFALNRALHIGHLFRPFIDQQNEQIDFRMVVGNRLGDILQQHGFTGPRRRYDQRTLAFTLRRNNIDDAG